jgi:hypothetical protein
MKKEKIVFGLISLDQKTQVVITNHAKKIKIKIVMIINSKLSYFKFLTLMNPLQDAKANETVP